ENAREIRPHLKISAHFCRGRFYGHRVGKRLMPGGGDYSVRRTPRPAGRRVGPFAAVACGGLLLAVAGGRIARGAGRRDVDVRRLDIGVDVDVATGAAMTDIATEIEEGGDADDENEDNAKEEPAAAPVAACIDDRGFVPDRLAPVFKIAFVHDRLLGRKNATATSGVPRAGSAQAGDTCSIRASVRPSCP